MGDLGTGRQQDEASKFFTARLTHLKPVADFSRKDDGSVKWGSLSGPDQLDAHEQYNRERLIAMEEAKILRHVVARSGRA